jgi:hypothetical protein
MSYGGQEIPRVAIFDQQGTIRLVCSSDLPFLVSQAESDGNIPTMLDSLLAANAIRPE